MAPSTRLTERASTPIETSKSKEHNTIKKVRFFDAYDAKDPGESMVALATRCDIPRSTAIRWVQQRELDGLSTYRRKRKLSNRLGRPSKVSPELCRKLCDPAQNPVRDQHLEAQISYFDVPVKKQQLRKKLKQHTNKGQKYKQAFIKKQISNKNQGERSQYGERHLGKNVDGFWSYVVFTDEAHIDPGSTAQGWILREQGTRYDAENIQERGSKQGNKLHMAGWINWYQKSPELTFYNDEEDTTTKPKRPRKPRKTKYQTQEEYDLQVLHWEASQPHEKEVKTKGNSMTEEYYCENILPLYIKAVHDLRRDELGIPNTWLLQEDGDPSHGLRTQGLAYHLKYKNQVDNLQHPAQSPDLNPIEAIWNILKQRIRRRVWRSLEELKDIAQEEWKKITMQEVRARIADMPRRCQLLVKTGGKAIKSAEW